MQQYASQLMVASVCFYVCVCGEEGGREGGAAGRGKTYLLYGSWVLRLLLPLQVIEERTREGRGGRETNQLPHSIFLG